MVISLLINIQELPLIINKYKKYYRVNLNKYLFSVNTDNKLLRSTPERKVTVENS